VAVGGRSAGDISFDITGDTTRLGAKIERDLTRAVAGVNRQLSTTMSRNLAGIAPRVAPWTALSGAVRTLNADTARATSSFNALQAAKARALAPNALPALNGHMQSALSSVNSLGSGFTKMGMSGRSGGQAAVAAISAIAGAALAATTAITGLGVAIATVGFKAASSLQNVSMAFDAFGSQLKDIDPSSVVTALREMSIQSGVTLERLGKVTQGFVALGVSGEGSLAIVHTGLSALARAGNLSEGSINDLTKALRQIGSKPFLQLEELNQIAEHLPISRLQVIDQIVKDTGDSVAEVQKRFKLGTQEGGDALNAVLAVMKNMDPESKALERRLQTIGGAFDSLKQRASLALGDLFNAENGPAAQVAKAFNSINVEDMMTRVAQPIADFLSQVIPKLVEALPDIIEGLAFAFQVLGPVIIGAVEAAAAFARVFVENKDAINGAISNVSDLMTGLIDVVEAIAPGLQPILVNLGIGLELLGRFGQALSFLSPVFKMIGKIAGNMFNPFFGSINMGLHAIEQMLEAIGLIPSSIPFFGSVASEADAAARSVHNLRMQLSSLGSASVSVGDDMGASASADALKDPKFLDSLKPETEFKMPNFPNTGAGMSGAASAAASKAKAAADALRNSLESLFEDLNKYAKDTGQESLSSLQSSAERILKEMKDAVEKANEAGNKSLARTLSNQMGVFRRTNARLIALAKRRDKVLDQLNKAKDNLKSLKDESKSFTDMIKNNVRDLGSVMRDTGGIDVTFTGMRNNLRKALMQTRQFTTAINQLRAMGLNETSLRQIAEAGPGEGLRQAIILARSGQGGVNQINVLQGELEKAGQTLATGLNNEFYTAGIKAAEGLVKGLDSQHAALVKAMDRMADALVARIKSKLKIHSPSQLMEEEVGEMLPAGVARGIRRGTPDVTAAMEKMAAINNRSNFGPGSVVVQGVSDERAARRSGMLVGAGIRAALEENQAELKLRGEG
jgi:gas vesicle protein